MKTKFLSAVLLGGFLAASTGTFVSCKDYDDDITELWDAINANQKSIDQINTLISGGSVITGVSSTSNGVAITLSNGTSYTITNGADGKDGANGTNGTVWTIGNDGYWYKDGVATTYKAVGTDGTNGVDGANGADGAAGVYYVPNENGYFDIYNADGTLKESTQIAWTGTGVTAAETSTDVILSNVLGADGKTTTITISKTNNLRSLVFVPQVYVDGVQGLTYDQFTYNALTLTDKDKQTEKATVADAATTVNPTVYAEYHVNPSTADIDKIKDNLSYIVKANLDYISSRPATKASASEDFSATPEFVSFADGILKVKVNVTGVAATDDKISVIALNVAKENGEDVTSDYATLFKKDLNDLAIADTEKGAKAKSIATPFDEHYRTFINDNDEKAHLSDVKVWDDATTDVKVDTSFVYTGSLNLDSIVVAHELGEDACAVKVADLEKLGLKFNYEVVKNYELGTPATPQDEFVTLSGSTLTARVYDATNGKRAAIGRTPIIRVTLVDTNNKDAIVKVAYLKVRIVDTADAPVDNETIALEVPAFKFECGKDTSNAVTVKEINVKIYNELGLSFEQFLAKYPTFDDYGASLTPAEVGTVTSSTNGEAPESNVVTWKLTNAELWANAGKTLTHKVRYYADTEKKGNYVEFELTSSVAGVAKSYDLDETKYILNMWDAQVTHANFNVSVPQSTTETDKDKCLFINDLNSPFVTWSASDAGTTGVIALDESVSNIKFYFCKKEVEAIKKIGDIDVVFAVSEDGTTSTLSATVGGKTEEIATIKNDGSVKSTSGVELPNAITYSKTSAIAKQLLNTDQMYTYIGAKGYVCGDKDHEVSITFKGADHFQVDFIRPVNIATKSASNFIDGVDYEEAGSYIKLEDLVAPYDWRNRQFSQYTNYWKYYGDFTITVDTKTAMCDLNAEGATAKEITLATGAKVKAIAVPSTVELKQISDTTFGKGSSNYGFITYQNNGTTVNAAYNIYVKVTVAYGWGEIVTDYITVPVSTTIGQ